MQERLEKGMLQKGRKKKRGFCNIVFYTKIPQEYSQMGFKDARKTTRRNKYTMTRVSSNRGGKDGKSKSTGNS